MTQRRQWANPCSLILNIEGVIDHSSLLSRSWPKSAIITIYYITFFILNKIIIYIPVAGDSTVDPSSHFDHSFICSCLLINCWVCCCWKYHLGDFEVSYFCSLSKKALAVTLLHTIPRVKLTIAVMYLAFASNTVLLSHVRLVVFFFCVLLICVLSCC